MQERQQKNCPGLNPRTVCFADALCNFIFFVLLHRTVQPVSVAVAGAP